MNPSQTFQRFLLWLKYLVIATLLIYASEFLSGCSSSKKIIDKKVEKIDSTSSTTTKTEKSKDSLVTKKSDSTGKSTKDNTKEYTKETTIEFDSTGTLTITNGTAEEYLPKVLTGIKKIKIYETGKKTQKETQEVNKKTNEEILVKTNELDSSNKTTTLQKSSTEIHKDVYGC